MRSDKRKVAVVGTGMVGMSYAYSLLNQSVCDELTLIDINKTRYKPRACVCSFQYENISRKL